MNDPADREVDLYAVSAARLRAADWSAVIVYCDGGTSPHPKTALSAYRYRDGEWLSIHSVEFAGESVILPDNSIDLIADDPIVEPVDAAARTQYRWRCTHPTCRFDVIANDADAVHHIFTYYTRQGGMVSLTAIDTIQKANAKRRR